MLSSLFILLVVSIIFVCTNLHSLAYLHQLFWIKHKYCAYFSLGPAPKYMQQSLMNAYFSCLFSCYALPSACSVRVVLKVSFLWISSNFTLLGISLSGCAFQHRLPPPSLYIYLYILFAGYALFFSFVLFSFMLHCKLIWNEVFVGFLLAFTVFTLTQRYGS